MNNSVLTVVRSAVVKRLALIVANLLTGLALPAMATSGFVSPALVRAFPPLILSLHDSYPGDFYGYDERGRPIEERSGNDLVMPISPHEQLESRATRPAQFMPHTYDPHQRLRETRATVATETEAKPKGKWMSPEAAADADAKEIADSHRGDPSYPSGRHGEGPRETARDLGELIKESEKAGKLPEYVDRLKEIQKTFQDRARANHPGGRR